MKKIQPAEELVAERIFLRKHRPELAQRMFEHIERDRARLRAHLPWVDLTRTVEDETNYINMTLEAWKNHTLFDYGLFLKEEDIYIGNCGVHSISWTNDHCEIGYWILGSYEGKGYVSEAVGAIEAEMFRLGFNRIEIRCSTKNERSVKVPRANGYKLETIIRKEVGEEFEARDTLVFAKVREMPFEDAADVIMGIGGDQLVLFTDDIPASREFYKKAFGLDPQLDEPEICEFQIDLQAVILHPPDEKSPAGTSSHVSYCSIGDFDAAVRRFQDLGAQVFRGPIEIGGSERVCLVRDPFGNTIGLRGR